MYVGCRFVGACDLCENNIVPQSGPARTVVTAEVVQDYGGARRKNSVLLVRARIRWKQPLVRMLSGGSGVQTMGGVRLVVEKSVNPPAHAGHRRVKAPPARVRSSRGH